MAKTVSITVSRDNRITVKTDGYAGEVCKDASKMFERLGEVTSDTPTEEMYHNDQIQGQFIENGGW
jgi:hypothetical protein